MSSTRESIALSKHVKYVPKHRSAPAPSRVTQVPRQALRSTVVLSSLAVAATGVSVAGGVVGSDPAVSAADSVSADAASPVAAAVDPDDATAGVELVTGSAVLEERQPAVSRSADRRVASDPAKVAALSADEGPALTRTEDIADLDPRSIAQSLMGEFGFSSDQFGCLDSLWTRESNWTVNADNPTSSAYGIPQALPGEKMASAGADWATNPATQIRWGLGYIQDRYGSPCGAWAHSESVGWY